MTSLLKERIEHLHKWFLDAAERFSDLRFAAVSVPKQPELQSKKHHWPVLNHGKRGSSIGLMGNDWLDVLKKPAGTLFTPIKSVWLQFDNQLWEGGFFNGKQLKNIANSELQSVLNAQFGHLQEAIAELERLANIAVEHLGTLSQPIQTVAFPFEINPLHRWLETVIGMTFVSEEKRGEFLVREVPIDLFSASAQTMDIFHNAACTTSEHDKGNGKTDPTSISSQKKDGETTSPDWPLSERDQLVLAVLHDKGAFDSDHRMTTEEIAAKAAGNEADANQFKEVVARLNKTFHYVNAKTGRSGGVWLTESGKERARKL